MEYHNGTTSHFTVLDFNQRSALAAGIFLLIAPMAEALVALLLENVNSLVQNRIGRLLGVGKEMEKLACLLSTICAVLEDAEEKQFADRSIKDWLQKLGDVSSDMENVLDDCELEAYRLQSHTWLRKVRSVSNVMFHFEIANKMKEIGERLDEIANEKMKFHLQESSGSGMRRASQVGERRRTSSSIPEPRVYGREEERERVVDFLVHDAVKPVDLSVFTIAGLGGLGKTTLAQLVYNDERISKHFEIKMWVCVSEDFDLKRLVKEIIESATNTSCEALEMDPLQKRLQGVVMEKRFLLVLDDIWNEDQEEWEKLRYVLACRSMGSSLIVPTRLKTVASIMGTIPMYDLSNLSEDDCWLLFKQRALGSDMEKKPNLMKIGKEIVKKCKGVPLAAKSLGGLLFFKKEEREWLSILHSELWNLPEERVKILPELRLSYFQLPLEHRRCFAYCALFPKDYEIDKHRLINLWMANGLICSKGGLEMEDIGKQVFDELCWISFIQEEKDIYGDVSHFKMHDLVHDLAQSIMKEVCQYVDIGEDTSYVNFSKRVRHVMINSQSDRRLDISGGQCLRTLLGNYDGSLSSSKFSSLRAYSQALQQSSLISEISNMKHLRYLDLSRSRIKILPDSICSLSHLLTLDLTDCCKLRKLPKCLNRLKRFRHLYMRGCHQLSDTPPNIGRLTNLKTLTRFMVSRTKGCGLDELGHLDLEDHLGICRLQEVVNPMQAKSANLSEKKNLRGLVLSWSTGSETESRETDQRLLGALVPSPNLTNLRIHNYGSISFPNWMSNEILGNVTKIELNCCKYCVELPALGTLASLQDLDISRMDSVKYVDNQRYDDKPKRCFMQLRRLYIRDMPNLERLSREEGPEMFSCLSILRAAKCPKLIFSSTGSVKELELNEMTELSLRSIRNLCGLTSLALEQNEHTTNFPGEVLKNLSALESLSINSFTALQELSGDMLIGCPNLERLSFSCCYKLESFPDGIFRNLARLQHISIGVCVKLRSLSDGFGELAVLESITLIDVPELQGFPELKTPLVLTTLFS